MDIHDGILSLTGWYGNWLAVGLTVATLSAFLLAFFTPLKKKNWRSIGIGEAYLVALFTEMFGFPLTIYLFSALLGVVIPSDPLHGHLFAVFLSSLLPISLETAVLFVMTSSITLLLLSFTLILAGWRRIHKAEGLVVDGIYGRLRHPQYLGFFLLIIAFLIQWPTFLTLIMAPILIVMYLKLAKREEVEMERRFGKLYIEYKRTVPAFLPLKGEMSN